MSKEPGQAAFEEWMLTAFGRDWQDVHDHWEDVGPKWRLAWAAAEGAGARMERAAVLRHLRSMGHHVAAGFIEAGKHRESEDE